MMLEISLIHVVFGLLCQVILESILNTLEFWVVDNPRSSVGQDWIYHPSNVRFILDSS
jgi:hypothetical protein